MTELRISEQNIRDDLAALAARIQPRPGAAEQAVAHAIDVRQRPARQRRASPWLVPMLAAAVVLIVLSATVLGIRALESANSQNHFAPVEGSQPPASRSAAPTPSTEPPPEVPWAAIPMEPYQPPAVSKPAPPASNARPCAARDVSVTFGGGNGAGGHSAVYVNFRNISRSTCVLKGYPKVTASEPGLPDVHGSDGSFFPNGVPANMSPGQNTGLQLETDSECPSRPGGGLTGPLYHHVFIALPGGGIASPTGERQSFDVTCGLHLTSFSVQQPDIQIPDPLTALRVSLEVPPTARAGDTLIYVTNLANPTRHAISLDRCPAYLESSPSPAEIKQSYQLNCAPVGSIGPGRTIRFAMHLAIPAGTAAGPLTFSWNLGIPGMQSSVSATVHIVAASPTPS